MFFCKKKMIAKMELRTSLIIFSLCFGVLVCVPESKTQELDCNFRVNIEQHLHNNGFHRNLSYIIDFATEYEENLEWTASGDCHIGLEQLLPAGVYTSPDEVTRHVIIKSPVNIEEAAEESKDITVHIISQVKDSKVTVSLPVHARYHSAVAGGGRKGNKIKTPKIYLNCMDDKLNCVEKEETSGINNFCPTSGKCPWKKLPIFMVTNTINWEVPVGNTDHYYIVAVGTVFFTVAGSLYLLKTLHEYTINNKKIKSKMK